MNIPKISFAGAVVAVLFFSTIAISYQQPPFFDLEGPIECIDFEPAEKTINIDCDHASFEDLIRTINNQSILEKLDEDGQYILKANLRVADGATFEMTSNGVDNLQYLKTCWRKWNNSSWKNTDRWCKNNLLEFFYKRRYSTR